MEPSNQAPLSPDEEFSYLSKIAQSEGSERSRLVAEFVLRNQSLAAHIARLFYPRMASRHELKDLVQEGVIALYDAVDRYDLTIGSKFSYYATWRIKRALTRLDNLGGNVIKSLKKSPEELNDSSSWLAYGQNGDEWEEIFSKLSKFPMIDRIVFRLNYGLNCEKMSVREISENIGLKEWKIRQTIKEILKEIRNED